jgi:hypothetical protein
VNRGLLDGDKLVIIKPEDDVIEIENVVGRTKQNDKYAKLVIIAVTIVAILYFISLIFNALQYELLIDAKNGIVIPNDVAEQNDNRITAISLITTAFYLITMVVFLLWFYTAYENLSKRFKNVEHSNSWSIAAWFVPIISFFRPFSMMNELSRKTNLVLKVRKIEFPEKKPMIGLWWFLFVNNIYISKISLHLLDKDNIDYFIYTTIVSMINSIVLMLLTLVTILMVKNLSEKEKLLFESEVNAK